MTIAKVNINPLLVLFVGVGNDSVDNYAVLNINFKSLISYTLANGKASLMHRALFESDLGACEYIKHIPLRKYRE